MDDVEKTMENIYANPVVKAMIPVLAMLLNIACPAVPAVVWTAILTAVMSGDLTPEHIGDFMRQHNIKAYYNDDEIDPSKSSFPTEVKKNG